MEILSQSQDRQHKGREKVDSSLLDKCPWTILRSSFHSNYFQQLGSRGICSSQLKCDYNHPSLQSLKQPLKINWLFTLNNNLWEFDKIQRRHLQNPVLFHSIVTSYSHPSYFAACWSYGFVHLKLRSSFMARMFTRKSCFFSVMLRWNQTLV